MNTYTFIIFTSSKNSSHSVTEEVKWQDGKEAENQAHVVSASRLLFLISPSLISSAKDRLPWSFKQHTTARYKCFSIHRNTTDLAIKVHTALPFSLLQ